MREVFVLLHVVLDSAVRLVSVVSVGCALAGLAVAQGPLVTPGQFLAGDTAIGVPARDQSRPAVAAGGGRYLVAWADSRGRPTGGDDAKEAHSDIWIQLLDGQGAALWSTPRRVFASPRADLAPEICWNGSAWLVAWSDGSPIPGIPNRERVLAARVDVNGVVLDPQPVELFDELHSSLALASDGQAWVASIGSAGGKARTVSATLALGPQVALSVATSVSATMLSFAQGGYVAVGAPFPGAAQIFARRFDTALNPIDPAAYTLLSEPAGFQDAVVGSNGSELFIGYGVPAAGNPNQLNLRGARVSPTGALLSNAALGGPTLVGNAAVTAVVWDGALWHVALGTLSLARVNAAGQVLEFGGYSINANQSIIRLASGPSGLVAAWTAPLPAQFGGSARSVVLTRHVAAPTQQGPTLPPGRGARAQFAPSLASSGAGAAALFMTETNVGARIEFARVDEFGVALDAAPIVVGSGALEARTPALAWDGQRYLAAWFELATPFPFYRLNVRRISAAGVPLDAAPITLGGIASPVLDVVVAGRNGEFVVAGVRQGAVFTARIRGSDGAVLNAPTTLAAVNAQRVSICATSSGYALAWSFYNSWNWGSVAGQLLNAQGAPGAQFELSPPVGGDNFGPLDLATSGSELLCVWQNGGDLFFVDRSLIARRVDLTGAVLDPAPFAVSAPGGAEEFFPDLAWDGNNYVCAYQRLPSGAAHSDVFAVRIAPSGAVLDTQGVAVDAGAESQAQPSALSVGVGRTLIASANFRNDPSWAAYRVGMRTFVDGCLAPTSYCTAKPNSQGCLAAISASGAPSASGAGTCIVQADNILVGSQGLLLYGYQAAITPFQAGFLCVAPPRRRTPVQVALATGVGPCPGQFTFDLNALVATGADPSLSVAGQVFACQYWSRDGGVPFGTVLSNALQGVVCW
jgi:hypothetical protein